jgi:heme A synthase
LLAAQAAATAARVVRVERDLLAKNDRIAAGNRRAFAVVTAVATFILLGVGGLVNPTGSSLACPDWPLCHGQVFPRMYRGHCQSS